MIRPITEADVPAVLAILETSIGPGWVAGPDLRPGPSRRVVVAEAGGAVAGVGSAAVRSWHDAVPSDPDGRAAVLSFAGEAPRTVVYLEAAAVDPAARGRGLYRRPGIPEDARCLVCGSPCDCDAILFGRLAAPA
jgi:hypothetical protein